MRVFNSAAAQILAPMREALVLPGRVKTGYSAHNALIAVEPAL
nr:hypothetical protein [Oscillatoria acuminata]